MKEERQTGSKLAAALDMSLKDMSWLLMGLLTAIALYAAPNVAWLGTFPKHWDLPISAWTNAVLAPVVVSLQGSTRVLSQVIGAPMSAGRALLDWTPWSTVTLAFFLLAYWTAGIRTACFTLASFLYIVSVGFWTPTMNTIAQIGLAIPIAILLGFAIGTLAARYPRLNTATQASLDFMQTIPTFAYLIPILLLFGFGPVVGLITSIIYAMPPMIRNTILGLQRVPPELRESGRMSGCTPLQDFWWVRVPAATPQLLVGLNQTTMAAFSMIIIASVIGGSQDVGWEVLSTMRKAQFGESLAAGVVIAVLAMILDRVSSGFTQRYVHCEQFRTNRYFWVASPGALTASVVLASFVPSLWVWPDAWVIRPAAPLDTAVEWITANYGAILNALKTTAFYYFLLPLKIGLVQAVTPMTWGFSFDGPVQIGYWAISALAVGIATVYSGRAAASIIAVMAILLFYGTTGIPWPVFIAIVTIAAYQAGGVPTAAFALLAQLFILVSGFWTAAMLSVYLCVAAVAMCIVIGVSLGAAAANNDHLSAILRPINDGLQTIPQFVLLIPALMFFQAGDFTALIAIVLYAIVPAIKYTEAGLRNVSPSSVEAGVALGCTKRQMFWQVRLPQAVPEILLGVNQTIMYALAMLVIAALVGTTDLGQEVYIALGKADAGSGLVAGISMALIAMIADRILQNAASSRKAALGLPV